MNTVRNIREAAVSFEAKKVSMRQNKDGTFITLAIHPSEVPADVNAAVIGTRYQVALVEINDQDEPVMGKKSEEGKTALAISQTLCRNKKFQKWMSNQFPTDPSEEGAAEALREYCGIESRSELKDNEPARKRLFELRDQFEEWVQGGW